jgi:hypothetical protein
MNHKIIIFLFIFILSTGFIGTQAQEAVLSSSGTAAVDGYTVHYSVGQLFYLTKPGTEATIYEGIQQPFEILVPIGVENNKEITLECQLYPNPADKFIKLKIEREDIRDLSCQLYNVNGLLLQNLKINSKETYICMDNLECTTYFIIVSEKEKPVKTFQAMKNR